ncbi:hypothetical protein AVEN_120704-1 [Araneus ventricosus]|uniref:Uncharacterized protein n=1 Tax=Araneus ventricosus TaxID=182803 RepID=A0A4Y2WQM5_ARAVE|nr:hypothetical protein AVEN_120704-1 [Araneus ventricosus]
MLELSRNAVRDAHMRENSNLQKSAVLDISVSYDETWQKRGYTSKLEVGCVIDIITGIVIDFEIYRCTAMSVLSARDVKKNSVEFIIRFAGHRDE